LNSHTRNVRFAVDENGVITLDEEAGMQSQDRAAPFGGFKESGVGREMGVAGLEEFLERKTFATPVTGVA
jgi:acyl-CoA reductase-like NAD-dependent aldehyde dehydrogenase